MYGQGVTRPVAESEFTFQDWNLFDNSPAWRETTVGSPEERKRKMEDPEMRAKLRAEWDAGIRPGQTGVIAATSLAGLVVSSVATREFDRYVGLTIGEIASEQGKHVVDTLLDIVVAEDLRTELVALPDRHEPQYAAQYAAEILGSPHTAPGVSDGGAHVKFSTGGVYPTEALTWLVRDEGVISLEEAHHKLSYAPAFIAGPVTGVYPRRRGG